MQPAGTWCLMQPAHSDVDSDFQACEDKPARRAPQGRQPAANLLDVAHVVAGAIQAVCRCIAPLTPPSYPDGVQDLLLMKTHLQEGCHRARCLLPVCWVWHVLLLVPGWRLRMLSLRPQELRDVMLYVEAWPHAWHGHCIACRAASSLRDKSSIHMHLLLLDRKMITHHAPR